MDFRDYSKERPVNDATFASFSRQFIYDKAPLGATIEKTLESAAWKADVVSIDAGYNNERLVLYVFLPKNYAGSAAARRFLSRFQWNFMRAHSSRISSTIAWTSSPRVVGR